MIEKAEGNIAIVKKYQNLNKTLRYPNVPHCKSQNVCLTGHANVTGGVKGVLRRMEVHSCTPDLKTFTFLLRALPQSDGHLATQSELALLTIMRVGYQFVLRQTVKLFNVPVCVRG